MACKPTDLFWKEFCIHSIEKDMYIKRGVCESPQLEPYKTRKTSDEREGLWYREKKYPSPPVVHPICACITPNTPTNI